MHEPRIPALLLVVPLLASAAGCAAGAGPEASPGTTGALIPVTQIPPPPAGVSEPLRSAWEGLRAGQAGATSPPVGTPATPEEEALRGFAALLRGDLRAARDAFGTALAARADLAVAAYGMGIVAERQARPDLAADWYATAVGADPTLVRAAVALRRLQLSRVAEAVAAGERAVAQGRLEDAVASYRQAVDLAPEVSGPYLRLADAYHRLGDSDAAARVLERGLRAVGDRPELLEPLAAAYRDAGRLAEAADAYARLQRLLPDDERVAEAARAARRAYEESALPVEYRRLAAEETITREELAAILAVNLDFLQERVQPRTGVVAADSVGRWSTPFIQRVVSWGILDVYQADFMPDMQVVRSMLVEACYRALELAGMAEDAPRPPLQDPPPEHLLYRPVQAIVGLGLMQPDADGVFDLLAPVSGREALETVARLAALIRERLR